MQFQPIPLTCDCGMAPLHLTQVGLTPQHQLVILWWCNGCQRNRFVVRDLADCWRDCPKTEDFEAPIEISVANVQQADADFLRLLGVKFPDAAE
jgi:hypothetical protein